jgi:hypothetical protein
VRTHRGHHLSRLHEQAALDRFKTGRAYAYRAITFI